MSKGVLDYSMVSFSPVFGAVGVAIVGCIVVMKNDDVFVTAEDRIQSVHGGQEEEMRIAELTLQTRGPTAVQV